MNRRHFIALAAAAPIALRAQQMRRIPVGFLGVAHSHALEKCKVVKASSDWDLLGVCAESDAIAEPFVKLGAKQISRDELFAKAEVVIVDSAVADHARDAKAALAAGKHVHVEKPPATNMEDMRELIRLAREKDRLLQVGYMWRYNPGFNAALEAARQGWLGEIFLVRATMNTLVPAERRAEWAPFKGGAMFEQGCHLIDPIIRLLGKPTKVTPHLQRRGGDDLADNCVAVLEFPKSQAIVTNSVLHPNAGPHRFLEILGSNGVARVNPIEAPAVVIDLAKAAGPYRAGRQNVEVGEYRRYVGELAALAIAIREKKKLPVSLDDELVIQEAVLRASDML